MWTYGNAEDKVMDLLYNDYVLTERILACEIREDFVTISKELYPPRKEALAYNVNILKYPTLMLDLISSTKTGAEKLIDCFGKDLPKDILWAIMSGKSYKHAVEAIKVCDDPELLKKVQTYLLTYSEKKTWLENPHTPAEDVAKFMISEDNFPIVFTYVTGRPNQYYAPEVLEHFILYSHAHLKRIALQRKVDPELVGYAMSTGDVSLDFYAGTMDANDDADYQLACYEQFLVQSKIMDETMVGCFPADYVVNVFEGILKNSSKEVVTA